MYNIYLNQKYNVYRILKEYFMKQTLYNRKVGHSNGT